MILYILNGFILLYFELISKYFLLQQSYISCLEFCFVILYKVFMISRQHFFSLIIIFEGDNMRWFSFHLSVLFVMTGVDYILLCDVVFLRKSNNYTRQKLLHEITVLIWSFLLSLQLLKFKDIRFFIVGLFGPDMAIIYIFAVANCKTGK